MTKEQCDYLLDLLSGWASVSAKAMFGGYGIYRSGQIFAIVVDDALCFKVGDKNRPDYEAAGSEPFVYEAKGRRVALSYWYVPQEVLDAPETLHEWAEKAYQAALASKGKTPNTASRKGKHTSNIKP